MSRTHNRMRDRARQRAEEREHRGSGGYLSIEGEVNFFKPKKGSNVFDILPYEVTDPKHPEGVPQGDLWYQRTIYVHYGIGAEEQTLLCPRSVKAPCPICEHRAQLMKEPDADEQLIKDLRPKERDLFNVLPDGSDDIALFEIAYYNFGKKLDTEIREGRIENAGFADLVDGRTLEVRFIEEKIGRQPFLSADRIDFLTRDDFEDDILEKVINLDEAVKPLPYEKIAAIFFETEGQDDEDDDAKDSGRTRSRRGRDEDTDDPPPRRGRRTSSDDTGGGDSGGGRRSSRRSEPEPESPPPSRRRRGVSEEAPPDSDEDEGKSQPASGRRRRSAEREEPEPPAETDEPEMTDEAKEADEKDICTACAGTGESSNGRVCVACEGKGVKKKATGRRRIAKDPDPEPEPPADEPENDDTGGTDEECIAEADGGKFGKTCGEFDQCEECPEEIWQACRTATDEAAAAKKANSRGRRRR